jgi:hypothetical protein
MLAQRLRPTAFWTMAPPLSSPEAHGGSGPPSAANWHAPVRELRFATCV